MLLLKKLAMDAPELLPAAIRLIAPGERIDLPALTPAGTPGPNAGPENPSDVNQPGPAQPEESQVQASGALAASCNGVVLRALERAGNKLLRQNRIKGSLGVPAYEVHTRLPAESGSLDSLLAGACDWLPDIAEQHGANPRELDRIVRGYCAVLLLDGRPLDRDELAGMLDAAL